MNLLDSSTYLKPLLRFIDFAELYIIIIIIIIIIILLLLLLLLILLFPKLLGSFQIPKSNFYPGFSTDIHWLVLEN